MKVAVTARGQELDSEVDVRFGRAAFLIVVDTESGQFSAHDNTQNLNAAQGAGIQTASRVIDLGVEAVLTGNVGPKAFVTLQAGGVAIYAGVSGSVSEALEQLKSGELKGTDGATVQGHWM